MFALRRLFTFPWDARSIGCFGKRECPEPNVEVGWRLMHHPRSKRVKRTRYHERWVVWRTNGSEKPTATKGNYRGRLAYDLPAQKSRLQTTERSYWLGRADCKAMAANLLKKRSGGPKLHESPHSIRPGKGCSAQVKCSRMKVGCKATRWWIERCQLQKRQAGECRACTRVRCGSRQEHKCRAS